MTDLGQAITCLKNKNPIYTDLYRYLDGNPYLKFSTERLERAFGRAFVYFAQNWGGVVVNAVLDRLSLKGFDTQDDTINTKLNEIYTKLNLSLDAQDVHEAVQVTGEGFLIIDVVNGEPEVYFNDPRMVEVFYDSSRPKVVRYAAKRWCDDSGMVNMALYYTDRTEYYISEKGTTEKSFNLIGTEPNIYGIIPVFHFRNSRRVTKGEFDASTISILDAVNKLFGDLMVAAEFEAFKMRVFISQVDPGDIKIGPDKKIWIPANESSTGQDTSISEIGGSDLSNFLDSIAQLANTLSITTRTPRHMFMNTGASMSGEALLVEEAPLTKKVLSKEEAYSPTWSEVAAYLLLVTGTKITPNEVSPVWDNPTIAQPLTQAQTIYAQRQAGIPLVTSLKMQGWDQSQIEGMQQDMMDNPNPVVTQPVTPTL